MKDLKSTLTLNLPGGITLPLGEHKIALSPMEAYFLDKLAAECGGEISVSVTAAIAEADL